MGSTYTLTHLYKWSHNTLWPCAGGWDSLHQTANRGRGGKAETTEEHLFTSNFTSVGLFPKVDIKYPVLKGDFAPVLIFSTYQKGFKTSLSLSDPNAVLPPVVLAFFVVTASILTLKCQVCVTPFPVPFKAFRTIILPEILNSKFLLPAYSSSSPSCDRTALRPVTCHFTRRCIVQPLEQHSILSPNRLLLFLAKLYIYPFSGVQLSPEYQFIVLSISDFCSTSIP